MCFGHRTLRAPLSSSATPARPGGYHSVLITFQEHEATAKEIAHSISEDLESYFGELGLTCAGGKEFPPNIYAIRWLSPSRILMIAEIDPEGNLCDCSGSFRAYEIELPNEKILRVYPEAEAKDKFHSDLTASRFDLAPNDYWDSIPLQCPKHAE